MRTLLKSWVVRVLALLFAGSVAFAQDRVPFRQEELDQMLAPIALYPDSLLSQMLMASTYPLEVVQAARWSKNNRSLKGEAAVKAVEGMDWDPSVKSLVAFPDVLAQMDEKLNWTERLGEAFLAQQQDVMESIQHLRRRADEAGNLQSNERMRVVREPEHIVIEPPAQEVVYVPYYSPAVVYGPWWYPAYPPVYWGPPPAYYAYGQAFYWGPPVAFGVGFFFGGFDWHHHHATVVQNNITNVYVKRRTVVNRSDAVAARRSEWRHDPAHRRGVPFRTAAARERFEDARKADREQRAERGDGPRVERRGDDSRTADLRQSRMDERRNGSAERRDDRVAGGGRQSLTDDRGRGDRQPEKVRAGENRAADNGDRSASDNRRDQPDTRQARPEPRGGQPDRDNRSGGRSERSSGSDRRSERDNDVTRFHARSSEPPFGRAEAPRPAARIEGGATARAEPRPAARVEPRRAHAPSAPAAPAFAERRAVGGHVRVAPEPQRFVPHGAPMPRAQGSAPAPRVHAAPRGGGRQDFGNSAGRSHGGRS